MKVIKPRRIAASHRVYENAGRFYLAMAGFVFFPFSSPDYLMQEAAMWKFVAAEMGKDAILDTGMPKLRSEVLLKAKCLAPGGQSQQAGQVRLRFGNIDKKLYIFGDRYWLRGGRVSDPTPFTEMEISWPKAFGGPGFDRNPVGKGFAPVQGSDSQSTHPLPNVENPDHLMGSSNDRPEPAGFGQYDLMWPQRYSKVGTYDQKWLDNRFPGFADDMDWTIFNAAPSDQQIDGYFSGQETIELFGMHRDKARIEARLPHVAVRCYVNRKDGDGELFQEVAIHPETVWLFPHAERGIVIYRGVTEVRQDDAGDVLQMVVGAEAPDKQKGTEHYREVLRQRLDRKEAAKFLLRDDLLMPPEVAPVVLAEEEERKNFYASKGLLRRNLRKRVKKEVGNIKSTFADAQSEIAQGLETAKSKLDEVAKARTDAQGNEIPAPDVSEAHKLMANAGAPWVGEMLDSLAPAEKPPDAPAALDLDTIKSQAEAKFAEGLKRLEAAKKEIEEAKSQAASEQVRAEQILRERLQALGMDPEKTLADAKNAGEQPATFSADDTLKKLRETAQNLRNTGHPNPELEAQLNDPALEKRLRDAEARIQNALKMQEETDKQGMPSEIKEKLGPTYRKYAQFFPSGPAPDAETLAAVRNEVVSRHQRHESLADLDLRRAALSGLDLKDANFANAVLEGVDFSGSDLSHADFSNAIIAKANLSTASLIRSKFDGANLGFADLTRADASGADFTGASLMGATLSKARLSGAHLDKCELLGATLDGVDLSGVSAAGAKLMAVNLKSGNKQRTTLFGERKPPQSLDLSGIRFTGADLNKALFMRCRLEGADFTGANVSSALFLEAKADKASFKDANLENVRVVGESSFAGANFSGATMNRANFRGANLEGANLSRAKLDGADLSGATLRNANLANARGRKARFDRSDLSGANLYAVDLLEGILRNSGLQSALLTGASLYRVDMLRASVNSRTDFTDTNLKQAVRRQIKIDDSR